MKKKVIISGIIGILLLAGITIGVALNNNYLDTKKNSLSTSEKDIDNKDEDKELINQEDKNNEEEEVNEGKQEELVKENIDDSNENKEKNTEAINPKEQDIMEGYNIFYKARDAYDREDFDEAVRLYETITNRDALAKVDLEKDRFYLAKQVDEQIKEAQKLYDSARYLECKIFMSKLIRGNAMSPKQEIRANELYEKANAKVTPEEENELNGNFTFEEAINLIKKERGDNPNDVYESFQEYTDIHGAKVYQIVVRKNGDINNSELFVVGSDGSVLSGS